MNESKEAKDALASGLRNIAHWLNTGCDDLDEFSTVVHEVWGLLRKVPTVRDIGKLQTRLAYLKERLLIHSLILRLERKTKGEEEALEKLQPKLNRLKERFQEEIEEMEELAAQLDLETHEEDDVESTGTETWYLHKWDTFPELEEATFPPAALAEVFNLPLDALRSRLKRWRAKNVAGDGWIEVENPKPREPEYLYKLGAIRHIIEELLKKRATSETTSERPTKKT